MRPVDADELIPILSREFHRCLAANRREAAYAYENIGYQLEEGMLTIDPIHAAGGCHCKECECCEGFPGPGIELGEVGICNRTGFVVDYGDWCKWSQWREARDNG